MNRRFAIKLLVVTGLLLVATPRPFAHHALQAQFVTDQTMALTGTLSKVDWINPHIYLYLDVKDESGKVSTWALETYPPAFLRRNGVTSAKLGVGQTVTARVMRARDWDAERPHGFVDQLTYSDGRKVTLGSGGF